jgi:plastocyanin
MNARTWGGVVASCLLAALATPARALPVPRQVVTAGSVFVVPEITIYQGDTLTLTNLDPVLTHDLVSRNLAGGVRIFASSPAAAGERVDVARVSSLAPGVYPFYCSLHESMIGNLRVNLAPAR